MSRCSPVAAACVDTVAVVGEDVCGASQLLKATSDNKVCQSTCGLLLYLLSTTSRWKHVITVGPWLETAAVLVIANDNG